jgi:hypothetical protein
MSTKIATFVLLVKVVKLTIEVRKAQKAWFKNHLQGDLRRSKQLEAQLDTMLEGLILPLEAQEPKQEELL